MDITQAQRDALFKAYEAEDWAHLWQLAQHLVEHFPNNLLANKAAGVALSKLNQKNAALPFMKKAASLAIDDAEALSNYAQTLMETNRSNFSYAESILQRALQLSPNSSVILNNLAGCLIRQNRTFEAYSFAQRAFELDQANPEIYKNLILSVPDPEKKGAILRYASQNLPSSFEFQAANFSTAPYQTETLAEFLPHLKSFSHWVQQHYTPLYTDFEKYKKPKKRLKIGFVSADFNAHILAQFLIDVLSCLKQYPLDCYAYSNNPIEDSVTAELKPFFRRFEPIYALSDESAARLIHQDRIDILFDLSGQTQLNRLSLFAQKPAPIAVTWLGWMSTSGIPAIDYILIDPILCPTPELEQQFAEKVFYTQHVWAVYSQSHTLPDIADLPSLTHKHLTLGAFHNPNKVSPHTIRLWAAVLKKIPHAQLLWMRPPLAYPKTRDYFYHLFAQEGIDSSRIQLEGNTSKMHYLNAHNRVDFLLDTFPVSGASTLVEGLLMGKPSLTLAGQLMPSRLGAHYLTHAGLANWVAHSREEYLEKAQFFAQNFLAHPQYWNHFVHQLRNQIQQSPLCDASTFAQQFMQDCQTMWQQFVQS